ncbi:hypothetical protein L596_015793 [Steinernema carpocapsae]|uniref:NR LBD domain-containing protein n=1 Tax=Steinernema carpocapsae TaxID=34508 RepID=A0A4U5NG14_STECR|nr:hypothetical protein L596_015793 [Steinernema carpocapsae]
MCRACRFRKCESVGMNKNDVQLNRDSIKPVDNDDIDHNQRERSNPEEPSTSGPVAPEPVTHPEPILVRAIYPYDMEILNKMLDAYRSYQSCQRSLYAVQNPKKLTTSIDPEPANLSEECILRDGEGVCDSDASDVGGAFRSSFPEDDRFKFLRHFYVPFSVVDQCYHSSMYFPNPNETRFYLHYKQYVDTRNLVEFFATEKNPEESAKFVSFLFVRTRRMINRFVDLKVSEMEAAALSGLLLWNVVTAHSTDNPIVEQKKDRIYFELHKLYTHLYGSEQTGIRFGKILSVASEIMEIARLSTESAFLSRIFDMTNERLDDVWPDL